MIFQSKSKNFHLFVLLFLCILYCWSHIWLPASRLYTFFFIAIRIRVNTLTATISWTGLKGTVQRDFNFIFFTYIDRPRPEYEPLLIFKFFRNPHDFTTSTDFFARLRRNSFGKIIFFGKFFLIAEIYFGIFFFHKKFISETYLLTLKRFRKAINELGYLNTTN